MGWLFRDLQDAPFLAAPFAPRQKPPHTRFTASPFVADSFLHDCEPKLSPAFAPSIRDLQTLGLEGRPSIRLVGGIGGNLRSNSGLGGGSHSRRQLRPIRAGDSRTPEVGRRLLPAEIAALRQRHAVFRARMDELLAAHQLVLLPCAPVACLPAGADHSQTRSRLLRYTAPFSLAGVPTIAIPCAQGGMQMAAARGNDESLSQLAAEIGAQRSAAPIP